MVVFLFLTLFYCVVDLCGILVFLGSFLVLLFLRGLSFSFSGHLFLDGLSFTLLFLRATIYFLRVYGSLQDYRFSNRFGGFVFCLSFIFFLLFISFSVFNMIFFYVSFEVIFLVIYVFLLGWGYSPERRQASFYMVFYTLVVSFPFLVYLMIGSYDFGVFSSVSYGALSGCW